jgi:protein-S-isoprenylcysteine O-methyltransferase Ste14
MLISHVILALLWLLYCFLHSLLADPGFKKSMKGMLGKNFRYYRLGYTIFAFAGLLLIVLYQWNMATVELFAGRYLMNMAGWILTIAGVFIMLICIKKYFLSLSGVLTLFQEAAPSPLMTKGLHKYVRHPLYLGTFMAIWGGFLLLPLLSILISNSIITVYTLIGIQLEEKKLIREFGDDYKKYQAHVPSLIPRLFKRKTFPELS